MRKQTDYSDSKSGVALIIVLGMLSVMTLLAVAFSIAMRIERLAARNYMNGVRAQHLVELAFSRATVNINELMTGKKDNTSPYCYPPVPVWGSEGETGVDLLTGEALLVIPEALKDEAASESVYWQKAEINEKFRKAAQVNGRIAYQVINTSGLIDANVVGGEKAKNYISPKEMDLSGLPDINNPTNFLTLRGLFKRFETVTELRALGAITRDDTPSIPEPALNSASNLYVYSLDIDRDEYFVKQDAFGTPDAEIEKKFFVNAITNLPYYEGNDPQKYRNNNLYSSKYFQDLMKLLDTAGIERPEDVAWNIVNWLDRDFVPQSRTSDPWTHSEAVEPMPMINEFVVRPTSSFTAQDPVYEVAVEWWFPYKVLDEELLQDDGGSFYGEIEYRYKDKNGQQQNKGEDDLILISHVSDLTFDSYIIKTTDEIRTQSPLGGSSVISVRFTTYYEDSSGTKYMVDRAPNRDSFFDVNGPNGYDVDDPRSNGQTSYWLKYSYNDSTKNTLGSLNYSSDPWGVKADPGNVWPNKRQGLPIYIRNGPMITIGDFGHVFRSNLRAQFDPEGGQVAYRWNTIDLMHRDEGAYLLDHATVRDPDLPPATRGLVSLNTQQKEVLKALFSKMKIGDPDDPKEIDPDNIAKLVDEITERSKWKPFISFQDIFTDEDGQIKNGGDIGEALRKCGIDAAGGMSIDGKRRYHNDKIREDVFRQIIDMITFRQNIFTVLCAAQVLSPVDDEVILAERRAVATIYRDSYTGRSFVRSFKWLGD